MRTTQTNQIMRSPCSSTWLKQALQSAMNRDALDAVKDAEALLAALQSRLDMILPTK